MIAILSAEQDLEILTTFENGEDALRSIPAFNPDIVIMDISLTAISGIACIAKIKPSRPRIQFMVFTVYEDDDNVFEALKAGANGYLLKKSEPAEIIKGIKDLYKGDSPMSASIARKLVKNFQLQHQPPISSILSGREHEVLQLLGQGLIYKEIAAKLSISPNTVRQHIHNIYDKLHVQNRVEALNKISRSI